MGEVALERSWRRAPSPRGLTGRIEPDRRLIRFFPREWIGGKPGQILTTGSLHL
jgi:hypothetical protein